MRRRLFWRVLWLRQWVIRPASLGPFLRVATWRVVLFSRSQLWWLILFSCANSTLLHAFGCSTFLPSGERIGARPSASSRLADSSPRPSIHPLPLADSDGRTRLVYRSGGANSGRSEISGVPPLGSKAEMGPRSVARGSSERWTSNSERPKSAQARPCPALAY